MLSQAAFQTYANFMHRAEQNKKILEKKQLTSLIDPLRFTIDDYDVRKKGDHCESYNKITGEALFEAHNETEAWEDLKETFLSIAQGG